MMASTTQAARRSSELPGPGTRSKPHAEDTVQPWSGVVTARRDEKTSEPGVYRRGGRYVLIYRDRQGRQHRKAAGRTLAEAKIAKAKILAAVATGDVRGGKTRVTFAQYVDGWVETYKGRNSGGIRPATKREYERALKLRVVPFFGRMRLVDVGPLDVKKFLSETAASGVSYDTTRLALAALRVVFPGGSAGGYLSPSTAYNALKPAARAAGVPWAGLHTLRHTCATLLFREGANAVQVQAWLGHHSPAFTLATYVHALADDQPDPSFFDQLTGGNRGVTAPTETGRNADAIEGAESAYASQIG
jgi:hypothetical protein